MQIIDDWLEDWMAEASLSLLHHGVLPEQPLLEAMSSTLCTDAQAAGYDRAAVTEACGGDIMACLQRHIAPPVPALEQAAAPQLSILV
jgi:hypothetical protein